MQKIVLYCEHLSNELIISKSTPACSFFFGLHVGPDWNKIRLKVYKKVGY